MSSFNNYNNLSTKNDHKKQNLAVVGDVDPTPRSKESTQSNVDKNAIDKNDGDKIAFTKNMKVKDVKNNHIHA